MGDYTVSLEVTDEQGLVGVSEHTLSVLPANEPPVAVIKVIPESGGPGTVFEFQADGSG